MKLYNLALTALGLDGVDHRLGRRDVGLGAVAGAEGKRSA